MRGFLIVAKATSPPEHAVADVRCRREKGAVGDGAFDHGDDRTLYAF